VIETVNIWSLGQDKSHQKGRLFLNVRIIVVFGLWAYTETAISLANAHPRIIHERWGPASLQGPWFLFWTHFIHVSMEQNT